ncbi:MAG: DUF2147 domain-containing protein [Pseudobdellovibrio sp.]
MKFLVLLVSTFFVLNAKAQTGIVGQWKTIDDETNRPKSIVEIFEKDGTAYGKILKVFFYPGEPEHKTCEKCPGDKKDQPIVGMQILSGLKKDSETKWVDGEVLDPKNGKTYSCKVELIEDGKKLKMRGFIGISLLGRTQVWERYTEPAPAPTEPAAAPSPAADSVKAAVPTVEKTSQPVKAEPKK